MMIIIRYDTDVIDDIFRMCGDKLQCDDAIYEGTAKLAEILRKRRQKSVMEPVMKQLNHFYWQILGKDYKG